jgi:hypothetical protein
MAEAAGLPSKQFMEAAEATAGRGMSKRKRIEQLSLRVVQL